MGTKVHCKSYLPGYYYSMRDLNEDSSSSSWPVCYGDNAPANGQYYNGFMPRTIVDGYPGYGKDALKQKMLEHEAIFKNQVFELHRLYRIQRDMMDQFKRKESHHLRASMEQPSSSSSLRGSQLPSQDARKWHMAGFPLLHSGYDRTSISGLEIENSPMSCTKGYNPTQPSHFPFQNGASLKESEPSDTRPLKVRKKLFDLQLPADEYVDTEDNEKFPEFTDLPLGARDGMKTDCRSVRCADLNEPIGIEEAMAPSIVDFLDRNGKTKGENQIVSESRWFSHLYEAGSSKSNIGSITNGLQKEKMAILSYPVPGTLNRAPGPDPYSSSSCFSGSRPHSIPPWANPTSSFTQKLTTMGSCLVNASPKLNPGFGVEITAKNGFYHGSASGLKETNVRLPSSAGFDYLNCSMPDNNLVVSDRSNNHVFGNSKPAIFIDLNEAEDEESKPEDRPSSLPWLKRNPSRHNGPAVTDLNQPSSDCEIVETQDVKKILGFPIFETGPSENVPSSSASTGCLNDARKGKRNGMIDINLECEPDEEIDIEKEKVPHKQIDLNSCVSDFEEEEKEDDALASIKVAFEIDLEAPVEDEDDTVVEASLQLLQNKNEMLQDELLKNAAETMVAISSFSCPKTGNPQPSGLSLAESLVWFVDAVSDELGGQFPKEMDDFEAMTLRLEETKEEDYMPVPFVPEFQDGDETGPANNALVGRPRRGQSRRGRQRRDFQRDILPGLVSLSRHEVTEDIQTFGGLMRATGHHWVSGSTRRNGGGRGRRRAVVESVPTTIAHNNNNNNQVCSPPLVQQINKIEGWGKTTRRPRRQRCPAGNNAPAVVLT
ncbi:hypothetical protein PHJA_002349600 [Phtheirospermum japonicum]|uniref:Uncharacterized protein n=1 Tax=Phtheirospermum japonicum TaxID=374723 RepID=A0A830CS65_9LAMI|nr:hypothetical protein PHJA_002349600 [Phtheirospermum japonicum]